MAKFKLEEATIADVHRAFKSGALTARRLVGMYLERIEAYDRKGPGLNAVITVNPGALKAAAALDAKFRKSGPAGPLHGIPVLLKDNVNTKDMPTTGGSKSLEGYIPPADAFIAGKLRDAGAILLAKANLHEFAVWGESVSSILGQTLNPYDLTRTPGGSSGGTGAALAANFGILGIGTDTVNSIRSPASANSIVGIRPTIGLVSRGGIIPYSLTQDTAGPMARTVADAAKMLNVLAGFDPGDLATAWSVGRNEKDYARHLRKDGLRGKRIGILRSFFGTQPVHGEVNAVMDRAIEDCSKMGAAMVELDTPDLDSGMIVSEISVHLHDLRPDLDSYLGDPKAGTPVKSLGEIIASGKYHPGIEKNIREAMALERDAGYHERLTKRRKLQDRVMALMAVQHLDALVFPHQKRPVVPVGESQVERNGGLGSVTGFPSIVVPGGFTKHAGSAPFGVPVGVEFLGRPWTEGLLVEIGYAYEQGTKHRRPPPTAPRLAGEM
ncbi:MAG: Glutamyl-tRNA(Gln) amidotransferase subunit A [Syntrophaceae bacterium PtaB.Bin038]|nr:MAG: Glutamyl-tRNA(Gln) amidotransferase subunit A [Syntrophaceae bacterium PtaB.Bin038]